MTNNFYLYKTNKILKLIQILKNYTIYLLINTKIKIEISFLKQITIKKITISQIYI